MRLAASISDALDARIRGVHRRYAFAVTFIIFFVSFGFSGSLLLPLAVAFLWLTIVVLDLSKDAQVLGWWSVVPERWRPRRLPRRTKNSAVWHIGGGAFFGMIVHFMAFGWVFGE
ncbi:MAG: hypothetical protein AAFY65_09160 [Pseudomonadota bacterium]